MKPILPLNHILICPKLSDDGQRIEKPIQHQKTTWRVGISAIDPRNHHPDVTRAGHAFILKLGNSSWADQFAAVCIYSAHWCADCHNPHVWPIATIHARLDGVGRFDCLIVDDR